MNPVDPDVCIQILSKPQTLVLSHQEVCPLRYRYLELHHTCMFSSMYSIHYSNHSAVTIYITDCVIKVPVFLIVRCSYP